MYEEEVVGNDTVTRTMYMFGGKVVAQRTADTKSSALIYLHGDHLGSMSAATSTTGALVSSQEYDPWGKVRSGGIGETKYNYTGQKLDDTGLLFYNARYYDPLVGRFVSPDSIVPGASSGKGGAGGTVGAWQNSKLTVDFHEREFLSSGQGENAFTLQKGFWFQLSGNDKQKSDPSGPRNAQALNRYSYTLNNPVRYTDPTGHATYGVAEAEVLLLAINLILDTAAVSSSPKDFMTRLTELAGAAVTGALSAKLGGLPAWAGAGIGAAIGQVISWITEGSDQANLQALLETLIWMKAHLQTFLDTARRTGQNDALITFLRSRSCWCIMVGNSLGVNPGDLPTTKDIGMHAWLKIGAGFISLGNEHYPLDISLGGKPKQVE